MEILSKSEIRKIILGKRLRLSPEDIALKSAKIVEMIRNDKNYKASKVVGIYMPTQNEINLLDLLKDDKVFCVPKIINKGLVFSKVDEDTKFKEAKFNILEPVKIDEVIEIDFLLVPAVAIFNCHRLGFGGGYYDKYLSKYRPKYVVGVIYDFQHVEFFYEDHDQKIDYYFKG